MKHSRTLSLADQHLERLIADVTSALQSTKDPRFVQAQRFLIGLRSIEQIECMECLQGLGKQPHRRNVEWMQPRKS